ncbi:MAG: DUF6371 domain-containing protein [Bacteroidales bacterium]|nr:DUF6371 domain-containing protein [Bacteroidales bacterium]
MENHRFTLEKYNGPRSRHTCPACGKAFEFVRYIDQATGEHLYNNVGRCNREESCGYHYTPAQYFDDGGKRPEGDFLPPRVIPKDPSYMDINLVTGSMRSYDDNALVQFLLSKYDADKVWKAVNDYRIGTSRHFNNSTVFWQVDQRGRIHAGKVMKYDHTGHRVKTDRALITWVHSVLKLENYNLQQCYFGQHLIQDLPVCIVESEKTAVVCSIEVPDFTWIATGGVNGARWTEKSVSSCLDGVKVVMYPDAGCAAEWSEKSRQLPYDITVSDLLESYPAGYDLADYFIDNSDTSCIDTSEVDHPGENVLPVVFSLDELIKRAEAGERLDLDDQKRTGEYFASKNPHYKDLINALNLDYGESIMLSQSKF